MKKIHLTKTIHLFLIITCLCITILHFSQINAQAAGTTNDLEYTVNSDQSITITGYKGTATELQIPQEIDGYPVTNIGDEAFLNYKILESIEIPNTVTTIGMGTFLGCDNLKNIVIPESVTEIGSMAFSACISLKDIRLPSGIINIEDSVFLLCSNLESIEIPDTVTEIGSMAFSSCESLKNIVIPESVTEIGMGAFYSCSSLKWIEIPDSVTKIGEYAFDSCEGLVIRCPKDSAAYNYGQEHSISIETIDILYTQERWNGFIFNVYDDHADISGFGYSFHPATDIRIENTYEDQNLPVFAIKKGALRNKSLTSVIIDEGIKTIEAKAFADNPELKSVDIPESVTEIAEDAFLNCDNMTITCLYNSVAYTFAEKHGIKTDVYYFNREASLTIDNIFIIRNGKPYETNCPDGISFDLDNNILHFNNYNNKEAYLNVYYINGLTLDISGNNNIKVISIQNNKQDTFSIEGDGALTLSSITSNTYHDCNINIGCSNLNIGCKQLIINTKYNGIDVEGNLYINNCNLKINSVEQSGFYGITLDIYHRGKNNIVIENSVININGMTFGIDTQKGNLTVKDSNIYIKSYNSSGDNSFGIGVGYYGSTSRDEQPKVFGGEFTLENSNIWCSLDGRNGYSTYFYKLNPSQNLYYYTGTNDSFKLQSFEDAIGYNEHFRPGGVGRYELYNKDLLITTEKIQDEGDFIHGDVDQNEIVDANDALNILKHAAKINMLTNEQQTMGDVDQNGNVDAADALMVLKKAAKIMDFFPPALKSIFLND